MKNLVIVAHCPSANTVRLAESLVAGAQSSETPVNVQWLSPFKTDANAIKAADGAVLLTTENFGYMSGALKDFFDRTYYDLIDIKRGLPYMLVIRAGKDGTGTLRAVESIVKGLGWAQVQDALTLRGDFQEDFLPQCHDIGLAFATGLSQGIF